MPQIAVKDLPDPLDQPTASQGSSPDDLLSQLADEAIDKLMADAERGTPAGRQGDANTNTGKTGVDETSTLAGESAVDAAAVQTELDAVFDKLDAEQSAKEAPAAVVTEPVSEPLESAAISAATSPIQVPEPTPSPTTAASQAADSPVPVDLPDTNSSATSATSDTGGRAPDVRALLDEAVATNSSSGGGGSVVGSIFLLPLRVLNAPFNGLSDGARNTLGQIGIMTLLNAVAVLVYVLWFRHGQ